MNVSAFAEEVRRQEIDATNLEAEAAERSGFFEWHVERRLQSHAELLKILTDEQLVSYSFIRFCSQCRAPLREDWDNFIALSESVKEVHDRALAHGRGEKYRKPVASSFENLMNDL